MGIFALIDLKSVGWSEASNFAATTTPKVGSEKMCTVENVEKKMAFQEETSEAHDSFNFRPIEAIQAP